MLNNLWQTQRPLLLAAFVLIVAAAVFAGLTQIDTTQITGVNRWLKPLKFSSSMAIFLLTIAVYLVFLPGPEMSKKVIAGGAIIVMAGEIFLVTMQAGRGTTSHFNTATPFDRTVFSVMAGLILINTILVSYLTLLYFSATFALPNAVVWGLRLGLVLFLLGSLQGGYMASQMRHSVAVADGGAGLPFVNWSTAGGDLRVAHFLGLHALQIVPLVALILVWLNRHLAFVRPTFLTILFSIVYLAAFTWVFVQALAGQPFIKTKTLKNMASAAILVRG